MENLTNKELLKQFEIIAGQLALAEQTESRSQKRKGTSKTASNHGKNKAIKLLF